MKRHQQVARGTVRAAMILHALRQRIDVLRFSVILGHEMQRWQMPQPAQRGASLVEHRARGRTAVLRKHRQHQDFVCAGGTQRTDGVGHRGATGVQHGQCHRNSLASQRLFQTAAQGFALHGQRGAFGGPDFGVLLRAGARAQAQDDAVQDGPPQDARDLHDTRISQQSGQEGTHVARGERRGRAGIHQQDAGSHTDPSQSRGFR
jgi:hypothetical protein